MLLAVLTEFFEFKPLFNRLFILLRIVVDFFAVSTLKFDQSFL